MRGKLNWFDVDKYVYIILMFFAGSFLGFIWEAIMDWQQQSGSFITVLFSLKGFLYGAWVPIYGFGFVLIYLLSKMLSGNLCVLFVGSSILCGILEYITSVLLEVIFNLKLWDYSDHFMNLNGRISLLSVVFFGVASTIIVKFLEPTFRKFINEVPRYMRNYASVTLGIIFSVDVVYSVFVA